MIVMCGQGGAHDSRDPAARNWTQHCTCGAARSRAALIAAPDLGPVARARARRTPWRRRRRIMPWGARNARAAGGAHRGRGGTPDCCARGWGRVREAGGGCACSPCSAWSHPRLLQSLPNADWRACLALQCAHAPCSPVARLEVVMVLLVEWWWRLGRGQACWRS